MVAKRLSLPRSAYKSISELIQHQEHLDTLGAITFDAGVPSVEHVVDQLVDAGLDPGAAEGVVLALMNLQSIRRSLRMDPSDLLEAVARGGDEFVDVWGPTQREMLTKNRDRLASALGAEHPIAIISKAQDVTSRLPNRLVSARAFSMARPVFNADHTEILEIQVGTSLLLEFIAERQVKEIYLSLDREELQTLADECLAALGKVDRFARELKEHGMTGVARGGIG